MIALLFAAAVAAQSPPAGEVLQYDQAKPSTDRINRYSQPERCGPIVQGEIKRQMTAFHGRMPGAQYAVLRTIDGCGVPTPVGYHPGYVLPGAADPTAKPEDGPERKR
jgi:hypothetical protein